MALCSKCGTEHDRHCPCHKQPARVEAIDPRKAKFAKCCPCCGHDEFFMRRNGRVKCTKCAWEEEILMPMPANAFYQWQGKADNTVVVVKDGQVNQAAQEQIIKALREGKDEEIIRIPLHSAIDCQKCIPPQPEWGRPLLHDHEIDYLLSNRCRKCGLDRREIISNQIRLCRPPPATPKPQPDVEDLRQQMQKKIDELAVELGIREWREGVFCGTTGDKRHVKQKALSEPTGKEPANASCRRCSRQLLDSHFSGEMDYICSVCAAIEILDAPPAWREKATP